MHNTTCHVPNTSLDARGPELLVALLADLPDASHTRASLRGRRNMATSHKTELITYHYHLHVCYHF